MRPKRFGRSKCWDAAATITSGGAVMAARGAAREGTVRTEARRLLLCCVLALRPHETDPELWHSPKLLLLWFAVGGCDNDRSSQIRGTIKACCNHKNTPELMPQNSPLDATRDATRPRRCTAAPLHLAAFHAFSFPLRHAFPPAGAARRNITTAQLTRIGRWS